MSLSSHEHPLPLDKVRHILTRLLLTGLDWLLTRALRCRHEGMRGRYSQLDMFKAI